MKIILSDQVAIILEAITGLVSRSEFSGIGFAKRDKDSLLVYDFVLLDVGSQGYTEIKPEDLVKLNERPDVANMKVWVHRHPVGNGVPGPHNWSGTDNQTISATPLGGVPQLVGWSASIVRTPRGWVGRVDNHISGQTVHVPVEPAIPLDLFQKVSDLKIAYLRELVLKVAEKENKKLGEVVYQEELFGYPSLGGELVDDDDFVDEEDHDEDFDDDRWIDAGYSDAELHGWSYVGVRRGAY